MAKSKYIEALEEQFTKKDAKSVLRYKAPDGKWRYVQTSKDASGGDTPTPTPTPIPSGGGMTEVTWQELKDKRDNGELNPGSLYRITDYNCTTTQENTRSAGHQFDIVLLALSEDKLAEEGWAMMNESNIYDVTFADGVTKKCYIYSPYSGSANVVILDTLLGYEGLGTDGDIFINEDDKTATVEYPTTDFDEENVPYNYFQNSNLSAWKVWYCLDNDKSRFTWADDSVSGDVTAIDVMYIGNTYERDNSLDGVYQGIQLYSWRQGSSYIATEKLNPLVGDYYYDYQEGEFLQSADTVTKITIEAKIPNGRGVIYRLIDEFNNDVAYDFKNIQFVRPMTDGEYDAQGTDTWVYTLNNVDAGQGIYDASLNTIPSDNSANNKIDSLYTFINDKNYFTLPDVVILHGGGYNNISSSQIITILQTVVKMDGCQDCIIGNADSQFYFCDTILTTESDDPTIYLNNKKVLTEE